MSTIIFYFSDKYLTFEYSEAAETIASIAKENPDDKVVIFLHGFTDTTDKDTYLSIKDALYQKGEYFSTHEELETLHNWESHYDTTNSHNHHLLFG